MFIYYNEHNIKDVCKKCINSDINTNKECKCKILGFCTFCKTKGFCFIKKDRFICEKCNENRCENCFSTDIKCKSCNVCINCCDLSGCGWNNTTDFYDTILENVEKMDNFLKQTKSTIKK